MKVLLVSQFGRPVRGVSPYSDSLLSALSRAPRTLDRNFQFLTCDFSSALPGSLHPAGDSEGVGSRGIAWWSPLSWIRVAQTPAKVVHLQYWSTPLAVYFLFIVIICRLFGKSVVLTVHNPEPHERMPVFSWFEQMLFIASNRLIVHGEAGDKVLAARLGKRESGRVRVVPHGIEIKSDPQFTRSVACEALGVDSSRRYICMFGNLRGYKGVDVLLEAWKELEGEFPDVTLIIGGRMWGEGKGLKAIVSRALGLKHEARRIREALSSFEGSPAVLLLDRFLSDREIDALLCVAEFAVFPYVRFSSQSGAASRAAGKGCPVLVTAAGELAQLAVSDQWVLRPGCSKDLALNLRKKLNERGNCRELQLERARLFRWSRVAEEHQEIYAEVGGAKAWKLARRGGA